MLIIKYVAKANRSSFQRYVSSLATDFLLSIFLCMIIRGVFLGLPLLPEKDDTSQDNIKNQKYCQSLLICGSCLQNKTFISTFKYPLTLYQVYSEQCKNQAPLHIVAICLIDCIFWPFIS